jgi:hypothetical protein
MVEIAIFQEEYTEHMLIVDHLTLILVCVILTIENVIKSEAIINTCT